MDLPRAAAGTLCRSSSVGVTKHMVRLILALLLLIGVNSTYDNDRAIFTARVEV
jgi:hypothetical protein